MINRTKLFWKANKFPIEISLNYLRYSTKAEKIFDFFTPVIITSLIMLLIYIMDPSTSTVLKGIKEINNQALTFISILAGFAIASISVLATAGSRLLEDLKKIKSIKVPDKTLFEIMMTFFCASVVTQFIIILMGVIILVISNIVDAPKSFQFNYFYWILFALWIYSLITTVMFSLRNLKTLFYILVHEEH